MKTTLLIAAALLMGCGERPVSSSQSNNPRIQVDKLFDHDGCTVYRFDDAGRSRYFTKCATTSNTSWTESCGKNCTHEVNIPGG